MKRSPLKRTSGLKRKRRPPPSQSLVESFYAAVTTIPTPTGRKAATCLMCASRSTLDPHHVVSKQVLRREGLSEEVVWDPRDGIALCRSCHDAHEWARRRVPRDRLPQAAIDFAQEHNLEWYIDRFYPQGGEQ